MKKSTYIPLLLTIYLGVMSYIGRDEFYAGNYVYYFSIIGYVAVHSAAALLPQEA